MKKVLVTGSKGFVGRNLCSLLRRREDVELYEYDLDKKAKEIMGDNLKISAQNSILNGGRCHIMKL